MNHYQPFILLPQNLSDEAAYELHEFLQTLTTEFENLYAAQIRRYLMPECPDQPDLFENPCPENDDDPPF